MSQRVTPLTNVGDLEVQELVNDGQLYVVLHQLQLFAVQHRYSSLKVGCIVDNREAKYKVECIHII